MHRLAAILAGIYLKLEISASDLRASFRVFVQILQISAKMTGKCNLLDFGRPVSGSMATFGCLGGSGRVFRIAGQLF